MSQILFYQESPYILEFEVKGLPKTTNNLSRMKWQAKHSYARKWKDWVKAVALQRPPKQTLVTARLSFIRLSSKEPDFDGLVSGFKPILDSLVECNILQNDRMSNIGQPTYKWAQAKQGYGRIIIRIEEVIT